MSYPSIQEMLLTLEMSHAHVLRRMFIQILVEVGRKLDRFRDGAVDEAADTGELNHPSGVHSNVTASILPPISAAVPRGKSGPKGG